MPDEVKPAEPVTQPAAPPPPSPNELLKTQPAAEGAGAGGWVPSKNTPIWAALIVGISTSVTPVLMMPEPKWNVILASVMLGAATSLGTYFGMRSAGPRQP